MLLLNGMKAFLWVKGLLVRWGGAALLLSFAVLLLFIFAGVALLGAIFGDLIFAGPEFLLDSGAETGTGGVTTFTPTSLDHEVLRIAWGAATAAVLLGMATILAAAVKVVVNEDRRPIFGAEADRSVTGFVIVAAILVLLGGLARGIVGSQMADALDVAVIEGSVDGGVGLWIFEVPLSSVTFITLAMSFLYGRARRLQEEVETIV